MGARSNAAQSPPASDVENRYCSNRAVDGFDERSNGAGQFTYILSSNVRMYDHPILATTISDSRSATFT